MVWDFYKNLHTFFKANIKFESQVYLLRTEILESECLDLHPSSTVYQLWEVEPVFFLIFLSLSVLICKLKIITLPPLKAAVRSKCDNTYQSFTQLAE